MKKTSDLKCIMHSKDIENMSANVRKKSENDVPLGCINKSISPTGREVIVLLSSALRIMFRLEGLILRLEQRG